jgi:hypothetical protein
MPEDFYGDVLYFAKFGIVSVGTLIEWDITFACADCSNLNEASPPITAGWTDLTDANLLIAYKDFE